VTRSFSLVVQRRVVMAVAAAALLLTTSCGDAVRQGRSPSYLVIDKLQAASGAKPEQLATFLESDVVTNVKVQTSEGTVLVPTVFEDSARVDLRIQLKDPTSLTGPTDLNSITIDRYHVDYVRADGRNAQGVDVPYSFDGSVTGTVTPNGVTLFFVIVRAQAKLEAPLKALRGLGGAVAIATLANVTFYGHDQAGNAVTVVGSISVNFADWGDPT